MFLIIGILLAAPCLFFVYYTVRLVYVNIVMTADEAAVHRTSGMLIGAIVFPLVSIVFGVMSWLCFKRSLKN